MRVSKWSTKGLLVFASKIAHMCVDYIVLITSLSSQESAALDLATSDHVNPTYWYRQLFWSSNALHQQLCHV